MLHPDLVRPDVPVRIADQGIGYVRPAGPSGLRTKLNNLSQR